ncbi:hypothetical protein MHH85_11095 [Viridibacillus sp. FSL E2-0187]|uniref:hypothetical protein n=1 Tax=Viridibacillus sp. FSL E2-0187 TaxID=2921362 RepID=UPI0030FCA479
MSEKVMVSKEVAEAINFANVKETEGLAKKISRWHGMTKEEQEDLVFDSLMRVYNDEKNGGFYDYYGNEKMKLIYKAFPTIRLFVRTLDKGYEIEQTPEDIIKVRFNAMERIVQGSDRDSDYDYAKGCTNGILTTLETLGMEIKGVNC